jgi:phenylacetate-CoA ligase
MNEPTFLKTSLGSLDLAKALASRAEKGVPAYRRLLKGQGFRPGGPFESRPLTDKRNYVTAENFTDLLAEDYQQTFTIFRSSGSSGQTYYWPQLKEAHRTTAAALRGFLEAGFAVHEKKTMAIVGLALGSWIGGEHFSWALKSMAVDAPYPFSVFSPGSRHREIIEMIRLTERFADQFILFLCPSAIAHLLLRAEMIKRSLPLSKMRYVVLGEPFPEALRSSLQAKSGLDTCQPFMFSVYGSADTGVLGAESPASVAARKMLTENEGLSRALGFEAPVPHLFHLTSPDSYLEAVDGELCVTRWQGIPLLRYNLHDNVRLIGWRDFRQAILSSSLLRPEDKRYAGVLSAAGEALPDLLAISGRADRCLILCGTNLTEAMLDAAVRDRELEGVLTGAYRARILYEEERQYLEFDLEFRKGAATDGEALDQVYDRLVQALGQVQPEFLDDWQNVYRPWDRDPGKRILRLNPLAWPALSEATEKGIKPRKLKT